MKPELQLPDAVRSAILADRTRVVRAPERKSYLFGLITITTSYNRDRPETLGDESRFWAITDDDQLEEFLFVDLLPALDNDITPWHTLPVGYAHLIRVLEFERHCDFEGWIAVSNKGEDEMRRIIRSYETLGLASEAAALSAVLARFEAIGEDADQFHDELAAAYSSVPNSTSESSDRIPVILDYIRRHPEDFGVDSLGVV